MCRTLVLAVSSGLWLWKLIWSNMGSVTKGGRWLCVHEGRRGRVCCVRMKDRKLKWQRESVSWGGYFDYSHRRRKKKKKGKAFWFTSSFSLQRTAVFHPISLSEDTMNKSVSNSVVPFPCFPHLTLRLSSSAPEETCAWHSSSVDLDQLLKHVPCNVKKNSHKKMILFYISSLSHL